MNLVTLLQSAAGVSTVLGLCSFIAVLYFWSESRQKNQSIVETILGTNRFSNIDGHTLRRLLRDYKDEGKRNEALSTLTGMTTIEAQNTINLIKPKVDLIEFNRQRDRVRQHRFLAAMVLFIILAILFTAASVFADPPDIITGLRECGSARLDRLENDMNMDLNQGMYDLAHKLASQLRQCRDDYRSWYVDGAADFYEKKYQDAIAAFEKAIPGHPNPNIMIMDLADSYLEVGGITKALELYSQINDGSENVRYKIGRAYFLGGSYQKSIDNLESVSTGYSQEGCSGKARVLEAAARMGLAQTETGAQRDDEIKKARDALHSGEEQDLVCWSGILSGHAEPKYESWEKCVKTLQSILTASKE
jgi:hypothetical protein